MTGSGSGSGHAGTAAFTTPRRRCLRDFARFLAGVLGVSLLAACGGSGSESSDGGGPAGVSDTTPPVIIITTPTADSTYSTSTATLDLGGSASDDVGVTEVSWRNDRGGSGIAKGTAGWSVNGVVLEVGINVITVTAKDSAGNAGTDTLSVSYAPSGAVALNGRVDSSYIARTAVNAVYVFSGVSTPDDVGSPGGPIVVAPVRQDRGGCTWQYQVTSLLPGEYTVAFTNEAAKDDPGVDDAVGFVGTATVSVPDSGTATHDFAATKIIRVGPGRPFATPSAAAAAAEDGDVIEIDAGTYSGDVASWSQNGLTLRGVGGRAHLSADGVNAEGKGIWVIKGNNTRVENIEFSGATVPDQNGAGIRQEGAGLVVCNSYFHDNENGILGGGGDVLVEYSEFANNGYGDGYSHNMYISNTARFTLRYSYSHHAKIGHNVKTRAKENFILYNRIMDEQTGTSSYAIDIPDCGPSYIIGNLIQQGPAADNSVVVAYGAEACGNPGKELYAVNNTIVNDRSAGGTFFFIRGGTTARIVNNILSGNGSSVDGPATLDHNLVSNSPGLVDIVNFDYHLTASSPARDAGTDPGSANGFSLAPVSEYVHKSNQQPRSTIGVIDIGAYEYHP